MEEHTQARPAPATVQSQRIAGDAPRTGWTGYLERTRFTISQFTFSRRGREYTHTLIDTPDHTVDRTDTIVRVDRARAFKVQNDLKWFLLARMYGASTRTIDLLEREIDRV
jgi:hypothetical protein